MERTFLFLGLLYFCCTREILQASPMKAHSLVSPHHLYMVERALEMSNYPTQDVDVEKLSITLGRGVLYKATFSNRGQHCYLQFSTMKYPRIKEVHRLVCDSPCPSGECEVEDMFFSRLGGDVREKRGTDGQTRTRDKGGCSHRKSPQWDSSERIGEGNSNYEINSGEGKYELSVSQFSNEIFDARRPHHFPGYQSRPAALHRASTPQELSGDVEPYYDLEESHELDGQLSGNVPSTQSTDGYEPFRVSKILPIYPDLDGSQLLTSVGTTNGYYSTDKNVLGHHTRSYVRKPLAMRRPRRSKRIRKHKKEKRFWAKLYNRIYGTEGTDDDIYV